MELLEVGIPMVEEMNKKLFFTSFGLNTKLGFNLISQEILEMGNVSGKKIVLFNEPYFSVENMLVMACEYMGFKKDNIILSTDSFLKEKLKGCDFIYCGEGCTFEMLSILRAKGLVELFQREVLMGNAVYIGASAGAIIGGKSIEEPACYFDRNDIKVTNYSAMEFVDGIIFPHFSKQMLQDYKNTYPEITQKYNNIYYVENDGILILDIKK